MSIYYFFQNILEGPSFHNCRKAQMCWLEIEDNAMDPTAILIWESQNTSWNICRGLGRPWRCPGQSPRLGAPLEESPGSLCWPRSSRTGTHVLHHPVQAEPNPEDPGGPSPSFLCLRFPAFCRLFGPQAGEKRWSNHVPRCQPSLAVWFSVLWIRECWLPGKAGSSHPGHLGCLVKARRNAVGVGGAVRECVLCHLWVRGYVTWLVAFSFNFFPCKMSMLDFQLITEVKYQ